MAVDIVGPFPRARDGAKYLLTAICLASKFPDAVPIKDLTAETVAESLLDIWARTAVPRVLLSDQGTQFLSRLIKQLCERLGVKKIRTSPYHPQSNGALERVHRTLVPIIRKTTVSKLDWTLQVKYALMCLRNMPHRETGFCPNEIVFGRRLPSPLSLVYGDWTEQNSQPVDLVRWMEQCEERIGIVRDVLKEDLDRARAEVEKQAKHKKIRQFVVGDLVLMRIPAMSDKLMPAWEGPYSVEECIPPVNYRISIIGPRKRKRVMTVHVNNIKPYHQPAGSINQVVAAEHEVLPEDRSLSLCIPEKLTEQQERELTAVREEFPELWSEEPGRCKRGFHALDTGDSPPIACRPYHLAHQWKDLVKQELDSLLEAGIIETSYSPWSAPIVPIRKKNGSLRLCVDFRKINAVTTPDPFDMPRLEEILDRLGSAQYITTLDLAKGYYQVEMHPDDKHKTSFSTPYGKFQFTRMPFGLRNAPATFQRLMLEILGPYYSFCAPYIDDIVIFSEEWNEHLEHLRQVFGTLREEGLTVKVSKCYFAAREVQYLGFVVGKGKISIPEARAKSVIQWVKPRTKKQLRSFLGTVGFYRRFIPNYARYTCKLTPSLQLEAPDVVRWTDEMDEAFEQIKQCFSKTLLCHIPCSTDKFHVVCDASACGLGGVLNVLRDGEELPVGFYSRQLRKHEKRMTATEMECQAVVDTLKHFEVHLYGRHFTVETDHKALTSLMTSVHLNDKLWRWATFLQKFHMDLRYRAGRLNIVADHMSRQHDPVPEGGVHVKALNGENQTNEVPDLMWTNRRKSRNKVFGGSSGSARMDSLFSSDWRARETALNDIAREAISLLLPHSSGAGDYARSGVESSISGRETPPRVECRRVQQVCMEVVKQSCGDSVLKVFLAALDLLKVVLVYSLCPTKHECSTLQELLKPVLSFLLTRCADAQKRVKECSIEAVCNLCLGQEGPLGVGSARGHVSSLNITDLNFVLQTALVMQERNEANWHWWLGRLHFMESILTRFSQEYLLSQCVIRPSNGCTLNFDSLSDEEESDSGSGMISPSDSISSSAAASVMSEGVAVSEGASSDVEVPYLKMDELQGLSDRFLKVDISSSGAVNTSPLPVAPLPSSLPPSVQSNLLMQAWFFAARATHIPQSKLGRVARRVIIRIAKTLRDDPSSLEVAHAVVSQCHRTQAEGLLDRVLQARESSSHSSSTKEASGATRSGGKALDMGKGNKTSRERSPHRSPTPKSRGSTPVKNDASPNLQVSTSQVRNSSPVSLNKTTIADNTPQFSSSPVMARKTAGGRSPSGTPDQLSEGAGASGGSTSSGRVDMQGGAFSRSTSLADKKRSVSRQKSRSSVKHTGGGTEDFVESDESFRSALSDFDPDCSSETVVLQDALDRDREEGEGSSGSHDSHRSGGRSKQQSSTSSSSGGSGGRGVEPVAALPGFPGKTSHAHLYLRQSTVDSVFSTDSTDTDGSGWGIYGCKHNIEQEEAEDLARVRSMEVQDIPHPALSLAPPTAKVLIHVQASGNNKNTDETDQASVSKPYLEGVHWVKGKLIGTGAFCSCFLARDMENGTMFAVKQVSFARNTESQEAEELSRLRDEVAMLGRINHPNIVRCLGATQHDRHINIFVEWMAGGCLDQLLHDFGIFGENIICNYTRQITRGIVFLHENNIIHRDLKGGNILVDSTGQKLRIADFGAAARLATHATGSGEFQNMEGTVAFMAPEVVKGGSDDSSGYGRKCDVWSIGCVIIQMATAKPPWAGTYDPKVKFQLIFKIGQASGPPPMPEFSNPALKDFALRCLEVNPKDRPTSTELLRHPLYRL